MNRLVVFLLTFVTLSSCSIGEDDIPEIKYELAEITANDLPDEFEYGKSYTVTVTYILPTPCSSFAGIDGRRGGTTGEERREIYLTAISSYQTNDNCNTTTGDTGTSTFSIFIDEMEPFKFYFWTDTDADNQPIYNEVTVPVVEIE